MQAVEQSQGLVHDIRTDLPGEYQSARRFRLEAVYSKCHTEHVNSFSSTRLPLLLLLVASAMMACASVGPLVGRVARAG